MPLIYASSRQAIEVAELMTKNKIHKLPVLQQGKMIVIVTATDLIMFLSLTRRLGLTASILHAITKEKSRKNNIKFNLVDKIVWKKVFSVFCYLFF